MHKNYLLFVVLFFSFLVQLNYAQPKMNEIYSRGVPGNLDWIEIYNADTSPLDISGYKIYDNGGQAGTKPKKLFPNGTVIPAHGHHVIITDTADFPGDLSGFGLSSGGEKVWFENAAGVLLDSVVFPAMDVTQTYGRYPDGSSNLKLLNTITRGKANAFIRMNEIYSRGVPGDPDWIEIHNSFSSSKDITGYKIYDSGGLAGTKPKKLFPSGSILPANGFLVIVTDDADPSGFGLSSGGETVWLEDSLGFLIDSVAFPAMDVTQSYSSFPDGSSIWQLTSTITKGLSNLITSIIDGSISVSEFKLSQNYPNPFNPTTTISYRIPIKGDVTLRVFNLLGSEVALLVNETQGAGAYKVEFNAGNLSSGIYFYQLKVGSFTETKKLSLMK